LDIGVLGALLTIIAIDLVLSGDNAVVIGMAARRLAPEQRRKAIIWGGAGAVVLRVAFTILAALLLHIPLLQAVGGMLLLWIAFKLLRPEGAAHEVVQQANSLAGAIRTIIVADAVMSLDNMLAVGGASHGNIWLLLFGLGLSIPILLLGSSVIARLIGRYPWLNYAGAAILVYTAMEMFFNDDIVHDNFNVSDPVEYGLIAAVVTLVTAFGVRQAQRARAALRASATQRQTDLTATS
jgi:YjbE family integral membrane protein